MGPDTAAATQQQQPPAIKITYTQAQLDAIRGNIDVPKHVLDAWRHDLAVTVKEDSANSSTSTPATNAARETRPEERPTNHNPWSQARRIEAANKQIESGEKEYSGPRYDFGKNAPEFAAVLDSHAAETRSRAMFDLKVSAVRYDSGLGSINRDGIRELGSYPPAEVEARVVANMERKLEVLRPGDTLNLTTFRNSPGLVLTADQTAALLKMRDDYRTSGTAADTRSPAQREKENAEYVLLCKQMMVHDMNGIHEALLKHAFKGYDPSASAKAINDIIKDSRQQYPDNQAKKIALSAELSKVNMDHLPALVHEYAVRPEVQMGRELYVAVQNKDMDSMRKILAPRTPAECMSLMQRANEYAESTKQKPVAEIAQSLDADQLGEYNRLTHHGFSAKDRAADAYAAYDKMNSDEKAIQAAFAPIKNAKGEEVSAYSAAQIKEILNEVRALATKKGKDANKFEKEITEKSAGLVDRPSEVAPLRANLRADMKAAGLNIDEMMGLTANAVSYGFDVSDGALKLRYEIEQYNSMDPSKVSPDKILHILQYGSDPQRTHFLSATNELPTLISAFNANVKEGDPNLRQILDNKLSGDDRVQALQIIDQGFYAKERAQIIARDPMQLVQIGAGVEEPQILFDRITQTDKEYKALTGKTLIEGIAEAKDLSIEKKAMLTSIAMARSLDGLHDELRKQNPDKATISTFLAIPNIEPMFNGVYQPAGYQSLRQQLEALGNTGRLPRDFVIQQECLLEGLPADTITRLDAELDSAKPAVGTRDSVLRNKTIEQIQFIEHGFSYLETERAQSRGQTALSLADTIQALNEQKKISSQQVVRAGLMMNGIDPFVLADDAAAAMHVTVDASMDDAKQKEIALDKVRALSHLVPPAGMDPEFAYTVFSQVRDIYEEQNKGEKLLASVIADKNIGKAFKNDTEKDAWVDQLAAGIYGKGTGETIASIMRTGTDPWKISNDLSAALALKADPKMSPDEVKALEQKKLEALVSVSNLSTEQIRLIRGIYSKDHADQDGGIFMRSVMLDTNLPQAFPDKAAYDEFIENKLAKKVYGDGMGGMVVDLEATITSLNQPNLTPEQKAELVKKLDGSLAASKGWGYMADEAEMYFVFFGATIADELKGLEKSGAITSEERAKFEDYLKN
ncbi:MAG: hypothetical protein J0M12_01700 [Deltaproteobacteria bacterium]|nr:hypothetical protein [Deltaproteobacteria bacterium]